MRRFSPSVKHLRPPCTRSHPISSGPKPATHSHLLPLANLLKSPPTQAQFMHYITLYAKAGALHEAIQLFAKMPLLKCAPTIHSLNQLLSVLCDKREGLCMVKDVLFQSHEMGIRVDSSTFRILIQALCRNKRPKFAIQIFGLMPLFECDPDQRMYSLVLKFLCEDSNSLSDAIAFVRDIRNAGFSPSIWDCCKVIDLLVKDGKVDEAYCFLDEMKADRTQPDVICYNKVLAAFCEAGRFDMVDEVFDEMLIRGLIPNMGTFETYIGGLAQKGDVAGVVKMFKCMERTGFSANVQIYNTMIGMFMHMGKLDKVRELMNEMVTRGIKWNSETLSLYYEKRTG